MVLKGSYGNWRFVGGCVLVWGEVFFLELMDYIGGVGDSSDVGEGGSGAGLFGGGGIGGSGAADFPEEEY